MTAQAAPMAKVEENSQKRTRGGAKKGERRGGRQKGTPNKTTGELKDMILQALANEGGVKYLRQVAKEDMKAFCSLIGRVLPLTVAGDPDNPVETHNVIEYRVVRSKG